MKFKREGRQRTIKNSKLPPWPSLPDIINLIEEFRLHPKIDN